MKRALRIAWATVLVVVGAFSAVFWVGLFWLYTDTDSRWWTCFLNCERPECGWIEGNGVGELMGWMAFQAVLLFVVVGGPVRGFRFVGHASVAYRGFFRFAWRGGVAVWAAGVAVTALVDLGIYTYIWISWAQCRVDSYRATFEFPTRQILEGSLAAGTVAALAMVLAVRMGRSASMGDADRGGSPHSA